MVQSTKNVSAQSSAGPKTATAGSGSVQMRKAIHGKEGFDAQSAALVPPPDAGGALDQNAGPMAKPDGTPHLQMKRTVQQEKDAATEEPSSMAYILGEAGKDPYDVCKRSADEFAAATHNRLEKMQIAIANFETNIILHADAPDGSALGSALTALAMFAFDQTLGSDPLVAGAMAVGGALVEHADKAKEAKTKDAVRQFILNYRTGTIQARMNGLASMSSKLTDDFEGKFVKLGEGSWKTYKRGDAFVEGPQGQYLRSILNQGRDAVASAQGESVGSMEQRLLESWVSGQSVKAEGSGLDGFRQVLENGYIRIVFVSDFAWSGSTESPVGVKSVKLDGAFLHCEAAGETVTRLKETMNPLNVWSLKCPKRVMVFESGMSGMGGACIDAEIGPNAGLQSLHDKYNIYGTMAKNWVDTPIPTDKFQAG